MLKTFFEKISMKDGDVLVNYTSSVRDATLERLYRYTVTRLGTDKKVCEAEDFTNLIQARNAAWSVLGHMVMPLPPPPINGLSDIIGEELAQKLPPAEKTKFERYAQDIVEYDKKRRSQDAAHEALGRPPSDDRDPPPSGCENWGIFDSRNRPGNPNLPQDEKPIP